MTYTAKDLSNAAHAAIWGTSTSGQTDQAYRAHWGEAAMTIAQSLAGGDVLAGLGLFKAAMAEARAYAAEHHLAD